MKLLSCHITSFGKLHDTSIDFNDMLTVIKEDNSFGKTTLADFITSMFYDLPDLRKQGLDNERRRYDPWQGGIYGGSLIFEYEGRKYEIERDFNKGSFHLKDISTPAKKSISQIDGKTVDGSNLGDILFEINKSSFRRSAYIPQNEIVCEEIESSLNDKLRNLINATDENHSLDKSLKILQSASESIESKRGNKGKLREINNRIIELHNVIDECKICFDNAEREREELEKLNKRLQKYEAEIADCEEQLKGLNEKEASSAQQKHYNTIQESIRDCNGIIEKTIPFFGNQKIENIDLDKIKEKINSYKKQQKALKDREDETLAERSKLVSLEEASIARQERKEALYTQLTGFENDKQRIYGEIEKTNKDIAALQSTQQKQKGALFVILCIITFGLFFVIAKNKNKKITDSIADLQNTVKEAGIKNNDLDEKILEIKTQIDDIDNSASNAGDGNKLAELKAILAREEELLEQCRIDVEDLLKEFKCTLTDFDERYQEIRDNYNEIKKAQISLSENQKKLQEFLKDKDETKLAAEIKVEGSIEELEKVKLEIDRQRSECIKEISDTENLIARNEEKADELSDYESELATCEEDRERLSNELNIIKKTIEFLQEANDNLANQYLTPLLEKTRNIMKHYDKNKSNLEIDVNSKILIKESGKERELEYFSKGIKELLSICMRISLVDTIFENNTKKPFIILDDPFVNLDDKKLELAKDFIKKLSDNYQIIYLTCHDSRKIAI